jgi:glycosyltransferase involved in cell wall biosynthesis
MQYLNDLDADRLKMVTVENVPSEWNPKKFALTKAIEQATGDWIVFTDADCLPYSEQWLNQLTKEMKENVSIVIGYSPYESDQGLLSQYIYYEAFLTGFQYLGLALAGRPYMAVGRNLAIKKSFFDSVGGYTSFKKLHGGDDDIFIQKFGTAENIQPAIGSHSIVYTYPKKTWKDYFRQKLRHLSVGENYKLSDQWVLTSLAFSHLAVFGCIPFVLDNFEVIPILFFYIAVKGMSYRFASGKLGDKINLFWFPFVDVIHAFIMPIIALRSKFEKDIPWTKN